MLPWRESTDMPALQYRHSQTEDLTHREVEVLRLLTIGRRNRDIADELMISSNTVIRHVSNIYGKIGVANRAEAAAYAVQNHYISL